MGAIAQMILDGELCEGCGCYLGETTGFPQRCPACSNEPDAVPRTQAASPKVACRVCGKRVKRKGLDDHLRDVHGGEGEGNHDR